MRVLIAAAALIALAGCSEQGKETLYGTIARGVDEACERGMSPLAIEGRKEAVREINSRTVTGNHTPSDCDSDGEPDFAMDANGVPLP